MFEANGWNVITAKYGDRLTELMERPSGEALRTRIDDMSNEEYQGLLGIPDEAVRGRLLDGSGSLRHDLNILLDDVPDAELANRIANLGGHDVGTLVRCYREASATKSPAVVFAYTIKGWGLPTAGDPRNHSALLTEAQYEALADRCGVSVEDPWAKFPAGSLEDQYVTAAAKRLERPVLEKEKPIEFNETDLSVPRTASTQDAFGRILVELDRTSPESGQTCGHRLSRRSDIYQPGQLDKSLRCLVARSISRLPGISGPDPQMDLRPIGPPHRTGHF